MHTKKNYLVFGLMVGVILVLLPNWVEVWGNFIALVYKYIDKIMPGIDESFLGQFLVVYLMSLIIFLIAKLFPGFSVSQNWKTDLVFYSLGIVIIFALFLGMVMIAVSRFQPL